MDTKNDSAREARLRRLAKKQGLWLRKSRVRTTNIDNSGGYMILDSYHNTTVYGMRFDLTLDDVERFLKQEVASEWRFRRFQRGIQDRSKRPLA